MLHKVAFGRELHPGLDFWIDQLGPLVLRSPIARQGALDRVSRDPEQSCYGPGTKRDLTDILVLCGMDDHSDEGFNGVDANLHAELRDANVIL